MTWYSSVSNKNTFFSKIYIHEGLQTYLMGFRQIFCCSIYDMNEIVPYFQCFISNFIYVHFKDL